MRLVTYTRKFWPHALITAACLACASYGLFRWLVKLESSASAANGLVLGVWGIIFSIVGFGITIFQIHKTQTATEAATEAVNEIKHKMVNYNSVVEIQKAIGLVQETQRHIKVPAWQNAYTSYRGAKEAILRLTELSPHLSQNEKLQLTSILSDISSISDKIDVGFVKGGVGLDRGKALRGCREHEDYLIKLSIGLQRKMQ